MVSRGHPASYKQFSLPSSDYGRPMRCDRRLVLENTVLAMLNEYRWLAINLITRALCDASK
jgi:hypothetical protein